jgi:hypothetical protein
MQAITTKYLVETTLAQMTHEGIPPFTWQEFAEFWLEGEVGDAIRDGELTKDAAENLIGEAWHALPDSARH